MDLELKLLKALRDEPEVHDVTKEFRITRGAYSKAMAYAKLVVRIAGGGMECYGYSAKPKQSEQDVITQIYFAPDQDATSSHVWVTPEGVKEACSTIDDEGNQIMGWWHSHGTFSTFHSGTDDRNHRIVLHDIAPQTVFRYEKADHVLREGRLELDGYTVHGVQPADGTRIRAVQHVKRDPFAYSFVVNERREHYLECLTKTLQDDGTFKLNPSTHPVLKIVDVDDDISFDIPELEWDIYNKLRINRNPFGSGPNRFWSCGEYRTIAENFLDAATPYLTEGGEWSRFLVHALTAPETASRFEFLRDAQGGADDGVENIDNILGFIGSNRNDVLKSLEHSLRKSEFSRYLDANTKYKRFELENLVTMQMMVEFAKADSTAARDKVVEKYHDRAALLAECAETATNTVKSLSRYCMEYLTDFKGEHKHEYMSVMSRVLANMATEKNVPLLDAVKRETRKPGHKEERVFLVPERVNIANQLIKDLYYMKIGKCNSAYNGHIESFLTALPEAYMERTDEVDSLIETHLLSIMQEGKAEDFKDSQLSSAPVVERFERPYIRDDYDGLVNGSPKPAPRNKVRSKGRGKHRRKDRETGKPSAPAKAWTPPPKKQSPAVRDGADINPIARYIRSLFPPFFTRDDDLDSGATQRLKIVDVPGSPDCTGYVASRIPVPKKMPRPDYSGLATALNEPLPLKRKADDPEVA